MKAARPTTRTKSRRSSGVAKPALHHGEVKAGPLTVSFESDESGRLHSVKLPARIPAGLTGAHVAKVIEELQRHQLVTNDAPPFHQKAWSQLQAIPWGTTRSYGRIAAALRNPRASRAVGQACAANRFALVIPCHRVVGTAGPGGFAWGAEWKRKLLELEAGESAA